MIIIIIVPQCELDSSHILDTEDPSIGQDRESERLDISLRPILASPDLQI